jgi:hypothetical protein
LDLDIADAELVLSEVEAAKAAFNLSVDSGNSMLPPMRTFADGAIIEFSAAHIGANSPANGCTEPL